MEEPFTVSSLRATVTTASNLQAVSTNLAAALACSPRSLAIRAVRLGASADKA